MAVRILIEQLEYTVFTLGRGNAVYNVQAVALADAYGKMGDVAERDKERPLMEEVVECDRRQLGSQHPHALRRIGFLGMIVSMRTATGTRDLDRAALLLHEAVTGLIATYGKDHPETQKSKKI